MGEGSWVGLDVHARSVVAGVIDAGSGEVRSLRVPAGSDATVAWLQTLPAPVRVVYEAGTTGYRLAPRALRRGSVALSRLVCLRGVSTLTAFALTLELGDWHRFRPESLGPFLGLTPSESSSGERRRQGAITKTGNSHARRLLLEAAWHQRSPLRGSLTLKRRREGKPPAVRAQADASARRLHGRWQTLEARGKPRLIVVVVIARELAGHCWALATID
jgi:transposase